ncbi:3-isopropylmalate dehydratase small subunit [Amycolatopsis stemonae]
MSTVSGRVWVFGDSLNTDAMYPAFAMKMDIPEASQHVFYDVRPEWTKQVRAGDVVVAGRNFGVGSSRPVAALFRHLRVAALVAEEFNSLFLRNAVNAGLPAITVPGVTEAFEDGDTGRFDFAGGHWANETKGTKGDFAPLPELVREILASGGVLPRLAEQGYLPIELLDVLKAGAIPTEAGA